MTNHRIAPARMVPAIDRSVRAGVHILVSKGNMGEFNGLTLDEAPSMVAATRQDRKRVPEVS